MANFKALAETVMGWSSMLDRASNAPAMGQPQSDSGKMSLLAGPMDTKPAGCAKLIPGNLGSDAAGKEFVSSSTSNGKREISTFAQPAGG